MQVKETPVSMYEKQGRYITVYGHRRPRLYRIFKCSITDNRVSWFVAIHQNGDDKHNPHAHRNAKRARDTRTAGEAKAGYGKFL